MQFTGICVTLALITTLGFQFIECRRRKGKNVITYADCGTGEDKLIHFHTVTASPVPVTLPGTLYLGLEGNLTSDLPRRVNVNLEVKRYILGMPIFSLPCLGNGVGSCSYDNICATLDHYEKHGCPAALQHYDVQCFCPFSAGEFSLTGIPINIPRMVEDLPSALLNGDYELQVKVEEEDGPVLGCLKFKFTMKKRSRGWVFKL